jgi:translocation and assembly module TamB
MRRAGKTLGWVVGSAAALVLFLIAALWVAGNTAGGRALIERATHRLTAGHVMLEGLGGRFPADLTLARLELIDREGVWLSAEHISLHWSPWALIDRRIAVDELHVARLDMERLPLSERPGGKPAYVPHVDVARFSIDVLQLGARLAGTPATLSARGGGRLRSLEDASADVTARRLDGDGEYTLNFKFDAARMDGTLAVHEPASGPLENILQLPGLGALSANLSVAGPRSAERLSLDLRAGDLSARLAGSVDLRAASADLDYALESPPLAPRPGLAWQRIALDGHWNGPWNKATADGHVQIDGLEVPGGTRIGALRAELSARDGTLTLGGVIDGLRIPGPEPALLAQDPLKIDASMRLDAPNRPILVAATHRLFSLNAQAVTAGRQSATLEVRLPDVAPFAALTGQHLRGAATLKAQIERQDSGFGLTLDVDAGIAGGSADWVSRLGDRVALKAAGSLTDRAIAVDRLDLAGRTWTLSASGSANRPPAGTGAESRPTLDTYVKDFKARWDLHIADLGSVAPELGGELEATGELSGTPAALAADVLLKSALSIRGSARGAVSAELHARGLPSAPSATLKVGGVVDGSPLELAASLERGVRSGLAGGTARAAGGRVSAPVSAPGSGARGGLRVGIQHGTWKSGRLEGEVSMESSIADSRGEIRLQVGELSDFSHLLGVNLKGNLDGNVTFTPKSGRTHAEFRLDGRDLTVGERSGTLTLTGEGATDSVAVALRAESPNLAGWPAKLSADAHVNLESREIRLDAAALDYREQTLHLLKPAQLSYGDGVKLDQLQLGALDAVLQVGGELWPSLDLRASLEHVDAKFINSFLPDALAEGSIEADIRLQGSLSAPTGRIRLNARGVRSAADEAVGLPALDLDASADLAGEAASIDVRLNAGGVSLFTVTGQAPLEPRGEFALTLLGKLDVGVANPYFEARGIHVGGALAVDATLSGKRDAPQIRGTISLADGNLRDYAHGLNLTHIGAQVIGSEGTLQIKEFKATAAQGTVGMTGSIGLLQPGIPVDLKISAKDAQAITSNVLTANLNADLTVSGTARERLAVAGLVHVNRATIGIPDSLPPDVAVLDVRRRGKPAPLPGKQIEIGLDVAIHAPRQVLVQGRGLDAELGGELHVGGTAGVPLVTGRFDLQRGTFTIGSTKLTFSPTSNVSFNGAGLKKNIDPTLDFTAQTTVQTTTSGSVQITVAITGYADSPQFALSSNTSAPQDEILSLLLFGEPAAQLSALQAAQVAYTLATLTGVGGGSANPLTKLQKTLGLDRLSVGSVTTTTATGATESTGAAIAAGRYVTKRIYVEGKQTNTGQSQVEVDVDLTKHLKLQTRLGNGTAIQGTTPDNDPGSSVGLQYQFEY